MQLETAEDLVEALRGSGLFTPEQLGGVVRDLSAFGTDLPGGMKYILKRGRITHYQLGKVLRGKAAELFVGPYIVLDKLGEGGMGKVFRARHTGRDRTVALKVIRAALISNPVVRGRYSREVQATGKLDHPNIVRVEDAGEADGKFYLAMEFIDGIDLSRLMRDYEALEIVEACEYARQAALGLQHAHDNGLVHRDIKPSNIVVAGERHLPQATEPAVVKILDLGLARAVDPDDMVAPDLTRDHTVVGTPDYMAPEQAKNSKLVDARADLYSLGCTLYFLLTGRTPFPNGNAIEKLMQHQLDQPPPVQALRPSVPTAVAELVARLMAKKPDDRFQSAAEFARAIAPHAQYPHGSAAVAVQVIRHDARERTHSGETLPPRSTGPASALDSSIGPSMLLDIPPEPAPLAQPVAPSDDTPRPPEIADALPRAVPRREGASTRRHPAPRRSSARRPATGARLGMWIGGAAATVIFLGVVVWAALPSSSKSAPNPAPNPTQDAGTKPPNPPPARPVGIVPAVKLDRLHALGTLVPDGTGAVAVAYPSAYFKEREAPFMKGNGPVKLAQFATSYRAETELSLGQSERVVLSLQAANLNNYALASEGLYLNADFDAALSRSKRLTPYRPLVKGRPYKAYSAGADRVTALYQPQGEPNPPPVYFATNGKGVIEKVGLRLAPGAGAAPDLDARALSALGAATEAPVPLLLAVVSGRQKLPFSGQPTLESLGAKWVVVSLRITDRVEIDVTVHAGSNAAARTFVEAVATAIREQRRFSGAILSGAIRRALEDAPPDPDSDSVTLKIRWTPEQWSAFLEQVL